MRATQFTFFMILILLTTFLIVIIVGESNFFNNNTPQEIVELIGSIDVLIGETMLSTFVIFIVSI